MICLSREYCSEWLRHKEITEAPYARKLARGIAYLQFEPPKDRRDHAFLTSLLDALGPFSGVLLQMTDWLWNDEYESDPTARLREAHGKNRSLIEVPGFLFGPSEATEAVNLGALALLLWEGDLIDLWSRDKNASVRLRSAVRNSGARILHDRIRLRSRWNKSAVSRSLTNSVPREIVGQKQLAPAIVPSMQRPDRLSDSDGLGYAIESIDAQVSATRSL